MFIDLLVGLGWPVAIVLVAFIFRQEIRSKFREIISAGPTGVTFRVQDVETPGKLKELQLVPSTLTPAQRAVEETILNDLKKIEPDHRMEILVKHLVVARLARHFEGVFASIFGSQVEGLKRLRDNGGQTSLDQATLYFESVKARYPQFYSDIEFQQWFRFLQTTGVAENIGTSVNITELGREFLIFVDQEKAGFSRSF
ncbi:hypothetical protein [Mesorhizobium sp. CA12]|uniref:hypothetical protein n=1 Tax=Mesorhizobium sp. CA12 TaxID=2876644 RepID=UPI001CCCA9FB|nr:hypothetical protein [Mesorhizobium sp. CA12]MBZ9859728.1 hypothetical protein [Mesorhizobium sp. CA12]